MRKIIILTLLSLYTYSVPTMEGLFRNSQSEEIDKNLVVAEMIIKKKSTPLIDGVEEKDKKEKVKVEHIKYLINNFEDRKHDFIYAKYNHNFERENLEKATYFSSLKSKIMSDNLFERKLLKAIISMYTLNDSSIISSVLKEVSPEFKLNKEVINEEKKRLLQSYMNFLKNKKEYEERVKDIKDGKSEEVLSEIPDAPISPLVPEEEEQKEKVDEIISKSMYDEVEAVKLVKKGRKFLWEIRTSNFLAQFDNNSHSLKFLKVEKDNITYEFIAKKYVTFSGAYYLPSILEYKVDGVPYEIQFTNFYAIESSTDISTRYKNYKKLERENTERLKTLNETAPRIEDKLYSELRIPLVY